VDDETARRIGHNEARFRDVNEALSSSATVVDASRLYPLRCECGALGCNQLIELTVPEYEAVRAHPTRFALADGHEIAEAERIVERHDRYVVVEKLDKAADVARDTDPRS
jgi:hypothetical protein